MNYYDALSPSGGQSQYFSVSQFNALINDSQNLLTIINFNIRSFYGNSDNFFCLFDDGNMPQIIILTETWFSNENAWNLEGYESYHTIRPNRRSGGVSVYVKNNLVSNKLQNLCICNENIDICTISFIVNN